MTDIQEKIGETLTYGGSGSAVVAWGLSLGDLAAGFGVVAAIVGLYIQVTTARRRKRQETEMHVARMKLLDMEMNDDTI